MNKDRELIRAVLERAANPNPEPIFFGVDYSDTPDETVAVVFKVVEKKEIVQAVARRKRPTCAACGSEKVTVLPNENGDYLCANEIMCIERLRVQQADL